MVKKKNRHLRIDDFHKQYFHALKKRAAGYESALGKKLVEYKRAQEKFAKREFTDSNQEELFESVQKSQVTYLGDFHTFDQSIKNLERILRFLCSQCSDQLVLGLELIHSENQVFLDQFLAGKISEEDFLTSIDYSESWKFPWNYYKLIFDYSIKQKIPIIALNSKGSLAQRDNHAANLINEYLINEPDSHLLILFGELHILPNKLPKKVMQKSKRELKYTIIHQNLDTVFWALEEKKSKADIIAFNESEFSLQNSPPWLKYESMIFWYEHLSEDPEFDIHNYVIETGKLLFNNDIYDNFLFLLNKIRDSLNLKSTPQNLDDYTLFDYYSLDKVLAQIEKNSSSTQQEMYQKALLQGEVFSLPNTQAYYCSSYTITRLAYLAGVHLLKAYSQKVCIVGEHSKRALFSQLFKESIFGYIGSKILNPSRKCNMYQDYKTISTDAMATARARKIAQQILSIVDAPHNTPELISKNSHLENYFLSQRLGYFLAEIISQHLTENDVKRFNEIIQTILASNNHSTDLISVIKMMTQFPYKKSKKPYF